MQGPIAKLTMADIVTGFGPYGHNLQDYIRSLTDAVPDAVARYELRQEGNLLCVYYITVEEDEQRSARWNQLVDTLVKADFLQKELLDQDHPKASREFQATLAALIKDFENWAESEGYSLEQP